MEAEVTNQYFARQMRQGDLDQIVKNEALVNEHPWTQRIFEDCLQAGYQCWVLANRSRIAAHGVMSVAIGECHLLTLCVHPDCQRQGYGRRLFRLLLDRAWELDARQCFLEVRKSNAPAIALYRAMGFTQVGERKNYYPGDESREDALILCNRLSEPQS